MSAGRSKKPREAHPAVGRGVRPTTGKVLEALLAILDGLVEWDGLRVLDAFAGAGQLGLSARERGAGSVLFIERDPAVASSLRRTVHAMEGVRVMRADARDALKRDLGTFDLVFVDPPYSVGLASLAVDLVGERVADGGLVVVEHHHKEVLPEQAGRLRRVRAARYGETELTFYEAERRSVA